jgi:hypothetical protein
MIGLAHQLTMVGIVVQGEPFVVRGVAPARNVIVVEAGSVQA